MICSLIVALVCTPFFQDSLRIGFHLTNVHFFFIGLPVKGYVQSLSSFSLSVFLAVSSSVMAQISVRMSSLISLCTSDSVRSFFHSNWVSLLLLYLLLPMLEPLYSWCHPSNGLAKIVGVISAHLFDAWHALIFLVLNNTMRIQSLCFANGPVQGTRLSLRQLKLPS